MRSSDILLFAISSSFAKCGPVHHHLHISRPVAGPSREVGDMIEMDAKLAGP